jgi:hypothetical protein
MSKQGKGSKMEISSPQDFEHFLHVGFENLRDASILAQSQQQVFAEVVARRHRKLPQVCTSISFLALFCPS